MGRRIALFAIDHNCCLKLPFDPTGILQRLFKPSNDCRAASSGGLDFRFMQPKNPKSILDVIPFLWASGLENTNRVSPFVDFVEFRYVWRDKMIGGHSAAISNALLYP